MRGRKHSFIAHDNHVTLTLPRASPRFPIKPRFLRENRCVPPPVTSRHGVEVHTQCCCTHGWSTWTQHGNILLHDHLWRTVMAKCEMSDLELLRKSSSRKVGNHSSPAHVTKREELLKPENKLKSDGNLNAKCLPPADLTQSPPKAEAFAALLPRSAIHPCNL